MGSGSRPLSGGAFHMTASVTSLPLSKPTGGGGTTPAFPSWLHSLELRAPRPLCYMSFFLFSCLFFIQFCFFSFFPGWGSVCPGGCADLAQGRLWEYCVPLSSRGGLLFPSRIGAGDWLQGALWFLHLLWREMLCTGWGSGGVRVLPLLGGFSCRVYLQRLSRILLEEPRFLLPPSSCHLLITFY
jgi:hypothetical protein